MNNHIYIKKDSECCGCKNCMNICPKKAINMKKNSEGFLYPEIDKDKCINCGMCKKVCPIINKIDDSNFLEEKICYGITNLDNNVLKKSTSGGAFYSIAQEIINNKGVVVGAAYDDDMNVKHIIVEKKEDIYKLMGSKYIYSDLGDTFKQIKEILKKGRLVLFTGVPCQVAALKTYLMHDYSNLITMDVICHGTPNQDLFNKYKKYLEKKYNGKLIDYQFRSKQKANWGKFEALAIFKKEKNNKTTTKTKRINADFDKYYMSFLNAENYRESCYECKYANTKRISDITVGDFWGIEKINKDFLKNNGVSALIISTKKGKEIFDKIKNQFMYFDTSYEKIYNNNGQLRHPSNRKIIRENWYNDFNNENFIEKIKIKKNYKKYIKLLIPSKIKMRIKSLLK